MSTFSLYFRQLLSLPGSTPGRGVRCRGVQLDSILVHLHKPCCARGFVLFGNCRRSTIEHNQDVSCGHVELYAAALSTAWLYTIVLFQRADVALFVPELELAFLLTYATACLRTRVAGLTCGLLLSASLVSLSGFSTETAGDWVSPAIVGVSIAGVFSSVTVVAAFRYQSARYARLLTDSFVAYSTLIGLLFYYSQVAPLRALAAGLIPVGASAVVLVVVGYAEGLTTNRPGRQDIGWPWQRL